MKKKLLLTVSVIALLIAALFVFTACDGDPDKCSHEWSKWKTTTEATCTSEGVLERQCLKCLTVQTDVLRTSSHKGGVASCNALAVCETCGQGYGEFATHKYDVMSTEAIYKISDASCERAAEYYYSCACGEKSDATFTVGEPLNHNYIYISNGDGTHTVVCTNEADSSAVVACSGGTVTCIDSAECALCGESYGSPLGHNWVKGATALTASSSTCESGEKILYTCSHCLTTKVELIAPVGHDYKSVVTAPTCNTIGYTTHTCEKCQDSYVDSQLPPTNAHAWDTDRTCEAGHTCTVCGTTEAALEHDYEVIDSTAANCTNPATKTYKCKNCIEEYDEVVSPALGHNTMGVTPTEELIAGTTCKYTQFYACTACGTKVDGGTVEHHSYTATITTEANCQETGTKLYTCSKCTASYEETISVDANNHVWNGGVKANGTIKYNCTKCTAEKTVVDASSSDNATVDSSVLGSAGIEFKDDIKLDMSELAGNGGALSGAGSVNISAGTLDEQERDSAKEGLTPEQKEQLGDNPIYNFTVSDANGEISNFDEKYVTITIPYTLEEGEDVDSIAVWYMEGDKLVSIKASYSNGYVTFKTNHFSYYTVTRLTPEERCELYGCQYSEKVVEATCLTDGYTLKVCIRCKESVKTNIVTATGHNYTDVETPATCTKAGKIVSTCSCGHSYTKRIPATGHNYVIDSKAASCAEDGYENGLCACGAKYSKKIPKLVHKLTGSVVAPTCENGGYTVYDCDNCDYSYKANITAALGHNIKAEWTWANNHKKADVVLICENGCGLEVSEKNVKVSEKNVEPTCYKNGRMECTVKFVYNGVTYSDTYVEDKGTVDHVFGEEWKHNKHNHWHSCKNCSGPSERLEHEFGEGVVTKKATCKSEGEISYVCFCGEVKVEKIPRTNEHRYANGVCADCNTKLECTHSYGNGEVTKAPTCTEEGAMTYTCTVCAGTKVEAIASLGGHAYDAGVVTTAPTCEAAGVKTFTCTVCQATKTEAVASLGGHAYDVGVVTVAPTCEAAGVKLFTCTVCQATKTEALASLGHSYNEGVVTTPNSCFTAGVKTYTCSVCQGTKTEEIPAFGAHSYDAGVITTAPTCEAGGVKTYTCTVCSEVKTEAVASLGGHAYDSGVVNPAPTCNSTGVKTFTCTVCFATKTEEVPVLPDHVYDNGVCIYCGNVYVCVHEYNAGAVTVAPSCESDGVKTYTCGKCGGTKTEAIPSHGGHAYDTGVVTTPNSCFTAGVKTFTCTVCFATKTETIPAVGDHSFDSGVVTTPNSCFSVGVKTFTCSLCGETKTEPIAAIGSHAYNSGEITVNPSCMVGGIKTFTCTVCSDTITEAVPAIGYHSYNDGVITTAPTCDGEGVKTFTCSVCSGTKTEAVAAAGHSYGDGVVTTAPTCTKGGVMTFTCGECGGTKTEATASLGGHKYENGVCTECGTEYDGSYYINLVNSWKTINGVSISLQNLSFELNRVEDSFLGSLKLVGSIKQLDIIELYVSFEDGEINGAIKGSVEIFNLNNGSLTYNFEALIQDGYAYACIESNGNYNYTRISVDSMINTVIEEVIGDTTAASAVLGELVLPALSELIDANSEKLNEILEKAFNIIFNTEEQADGSFVVTLDYDKLAALNENLATKTVAEVIDVYFGEGSFDSIVEKVTEILNLKVPEVPAYVDSLGIDSEELIERINAFVVKYSTEDEFDLNEYINDEDYADVTLGMLMAGVDDDSYLEDFDEDFTSILVENTLYELMGGSDADYIKDIVGDIIDAASDVSEISFTTGVDGTFKSVNFAFDSFVYSYDDVQISLDAELSVTANGTIDVDFEDIVDKIEGSIVAPPSEFTDGGSRTDFYVTKGGYVEYKGNSYFYDTALDITYSEVLYDNISIITCTPDCQGFVGYQVAYDRIVYNFVFANIELDGKNVLVLYDTVNKVAVELRGDADSFTVVYEDGTERAIVFGSLDAYENVMDAYVDVYFEIFENPEGKINPLSTSVTYYYNASTGEYAEKSHHEIEYEEVFNGETCADGRVERVYCTNCDYEQEYTSYNCSYGYKESVVKFDDCCTMNVYGMFCMYCEELYRVESIDFGCKFGNHTKSEILDENGNVIGEKQTQTCTVCGLVVEDEMRTEISGCEIYRTAVAKILVNGECVIEQSEIWDYIQSHDWEYVFEMLGETCDDGYEVIYDCKNCDAKRYYGRYSGHMHESVNKSLEELGCCSKTIAHCNVCKVCGDEEYTTIKPGCASYAPGDMVEKTDANGVTYYEISFTCSDCGATFLEKYYQIVNGCISETTVISEVVIGGECVYTQTYNAGKIAMHEWETTYKLYGENCDSGYEVIETCTVCGEVQRDGSGGHRTERKEIELSEYGCCGGVIHYEACVICSYVFAGGAEVECAEFEENHEEFANENGDIIRAISTYTCTTCGFKLVAEDRIDYENACIYSYTQSRKYYDNSGAMIKELERVDRYSEHNYALSYAVPFGDSCYEGYFAKYECKNCGDSYGRYDREHRYENTYVDFAELGMCGGWIEEEKCSICNEIGYSNINDKHCKWMPAEEGSTDSDSMLLVCANCNATKHEGREESEKDEHCTYSVTEFRIFKNANGEEVYKHEKSWSSSNHNYEITIGELRGESCEDGYDITYTCLDCGIVSYGVNRGHNLYSIDKYDLSEYGACGGYVDIRECPCGFLSDVSWSLDCSYISTSDGYEDTNGVYHNVYVDTCESCSLELSRESYIMTDGCNSADVCVVNLTIDGEEIIKDYVVVVDRWDTHVYTYSFNLYGATCHDGYDVTAECKKCDYSYTEENYGHMEYEVVNENLSDYGACGGYVSIRSCACGEWSNSDISDYMCYYTSVSGSYVDGDGNTHTVWTYTCQTCGLVKLQDEYSVKDEKCNVTTYQSISFAKGDVEIISNYERTLYYGTSHNMELSFEMNGTSCEEGYKEVRFCRDCGYSYGFTYSSHNRYEKERIELSEHGACGGYISYYSCPCGKEQSVEDNGCWSNSTSNEYYDEEGRLIYTYVRSCETCGKRYASSYYTERDSETCTLTYYYTVIVNVGQNLVANIEYTRQETAHAYETSASLTGESCTDGVAIFYECRDCDYSYSNNYAHHYTYEKERISLSDVCDGYAVLTGCACDYSNSIDLSHALCEFDTKSDGVGNENAIPSGWYYLYYTNSTSTYVTNSSTIYTCAVTDPEQCAYKIRKADYYLYGGDGCVAYYYTTWQFGYNEETGECEYEITYKSGSTAIVHDYVSENISETLDDGTTVTGTLKTCSICGTYCHSKTYKNEDGIEVKFERKFENAIEDGNYRLLEWVYEYVGNNSGRFGNYTTYEYYNQVWASGYVDCYEYHYEYDFTYVADFGENSYSKKTTYTDIDASYTYITECGYTCYEGYEFETYYYRNENVGTDSESWYRRDYSYNFEGCCEKTTVYTNSNGESSTNVEECHVSTSRERVKYPICTQHGEYHYRCVLCEKVTSSYTDNPYGHNWISLDDGYFCSRCGLQNANGADGTIVMEDLTASYGNGEYYVIGYWNQGNVEFLQYASLMLKTPMEDGNDEIILDGIEFITLDGICAIAFKKSDVEAKALEFGYEADEYLVRFSFVPLGDDSSFDYAITFTDEEFPTVITDDVSFAVFVGTEKTMSFTVAPETDGVWTFTSAADKDTYAYLYDAEGNELVHNDDDGENSNFLISYELEAGKSYTLEVKWYSSSNYGYMPLVFAFEPVAE